MIYEQFQVIPSTDKIKVSLRQLRENPKAATINYNNFIES